MKVSVDREACELHGQCVVVAPSVFAFDEDDNLVYASSISADVVAEATKAVSFCPAQAIALEG